VVLNDERKRYFHRITRKKKKSDARRSNANNYNRLLRKAKIRG
jgi:hypothetical protein